MKILATTLFLLLACFGHSQDISEPIVSNKGIDNVDNISESFYGLAFLYGQKYFFDNIQNQLYNSNIRNFTNSISIGFIGETQTSFMYDYYGYYFFSYNFPKSIIMNDTLNQKLYAYDIRFSLAGQYIIKNKHFHFFLTEGLSFGRMKLVNDNNEKMKNPFFAPYIGLVSGLTFSKFSVLIIAQFDIDLSSTKWKKTFFSDMQEIDIPNVKQSGLNISLGIAYKI